MPAARHLDRFLHTLMVYLRNEFGVYLRRPHEPSWYALGPRANTHQVRLMDFQRVQAEALRTTHQRWHTSWVRVGNRVFMVKRVMPQNIYVAVGIPHEPELCQTGQLQCHNLRLNALLAKVKLDILFARSFRHVAQLLSRERYHIETQTWCLLVVDYSGTVRAATNDTCRHEEKVVSNLQSLTDSPFFVKHQKCLLVVRFSTGGEFI